ncbi:MAG: CDP-alcohol phosphatidyltransferase family protein, partial [Oscillospiraceae bacterium]
MKADRCKEIFSIPNILGYFRILLIPFFMYTYLNAKTVSDYYAPAVIVGVSSITDMFDGLIARKFNMVTELGKLIDP